MADDKIVKVLFADRNCHAEVIHLEDCWQAISRNQHLPAPVRNMLGELTAAALMMACNLKFTGAVVLQIQGAGPVRLALVEVRNGLTVRATAQLSVKPENVPADATFKDLVNCDGTGRCAMILDAADRAQGEQPYQSVVPLTGATVAETLESFLTQSDQLQTRLWLAADETTAGGVLVQHVASSGGVGGNAELTPEESLKSVTVYAETVTRDELLKDDALTLARHLFWELNPVITKDLKPEFRCRCSADGIRRIVKSLGRQEAESIIAEKGKIEVTCSFCGSVYQMDAIDVATLFSDQAAMSPTTLTKQ